MRVEEVQELIVSNTYSPESLDLRNRYFRDIPRLVSKPQLYNPDKSLVEQVSQAIDG